MVHRRTAGWVESATRRPSVRYGETNDGQRSSDRRCRSSILQPYRSLGWDERATARRRTRAAAEEALSATCNVENLPVAEHQLARRELVDHDPLPSQAFRLTLQQQPRRECALVVLDQPIDRAPQRVAQLL